MALGGLAVGSVALGGMAIGYYAYGGGGMGRYLLTGAERMPDLEATARAARLSEDPGTREKDGRLGWITRQAQGEPNPIREAIFHALD